MSKRPACLIHAAFCRPAWREDAARGGPAGEIAFGGSLARGLEALGVEAVLLPSMRAFAWRVLLARALGRLRRAGEAPGRAGAVDFLVLDPWTLERAARLRLVGPGDAHRVLVLDSFGLSPRMVAARAPWLDPRRVLTPFPVRYPWGESTSLGLAHPALGEDAAALLARARRAAAAPKERRGVLWAKEGRYLAGPVAALVAEVARRVPLHATISDARGAAALPAGVVNHGHLSPGEWRALLEGSRFLLGVGDPLLGIAPLDALAAGCVYLNPRFTPPRLVAGAEDLPVRSQHPFLETLGPPLVRTVDLADGASVIAAVDAALEDGATARALEGEEVGRALQGFTEAGARARLGEVMREMG